MNPRILKNTLILCGVVILLVLGYYLLYWQPNMSSIRRLKADVANQEKEWKQVQVDLNTWPKTITREKIAEYEEGLKLFLSLIPTKEQIPEFLDQLQKDGVEKARLSITWLSAIPKKEGQQKPKPPPVETQAQDKGDAKAATQPTKLEYEKATYQLSVSGNFMNLLSFLNDLESGKRLVSIDNIRLKTSTDVKKPSVETEITLSVFYTADESQITFGN